MLKTVCVYCSSSEAVDEKYFRIADELGRVIGIKGLELIYGGASIGLMGQVARSARKAGARVEGVIPSYLNENGISFKEADKLTITETMAERKEIMSNRGEGFIALPGGFGTLEEIMEMITLRQLGYHSKPMVFINSCGFYDNLFSFFKRMVNDKFMKREFNSIYRVAETAEEAVNMLMATDPFDMPKKWF